MMYTKIYALKPKWDLKYLIAPNLYYMVLMM